MQKVVIFTKEALVRSKSGQYITSPDDQLPLPQAQESVKMFGLAGAKMYLVSNQGGVERGHKTLEDAIEEIRYCLKLFPEIVCGVMAPNYPPSPIAYRIDQDCQAKLILKESARIPFPGMINWCLRQHEPNERRSLMIGNSADDLNAAINAEISYLKMDEWLNYAPF